MRSPYYLAVAVLFLAYGCGGGGGADNPLRPVTNPNTPVILTGPIERIIEAQGIWVWGSAVNKLCQQWSVALHDQSGWFYGTSNSWSSADVYVLKAPQSPLSVTAAENFEYEKSSVEAFEGDTVFFRGRNGYYGAWYIEKIDGQVGAILSGTWYFKLDGGGDFTRVVGDSDIPIEDVGGGDCFGY